MSNANRNTPEEDFEFNELDLRDDHNTAMRAVHSDSIGDLDPPRHQDDDLYNEVVDEPVVNQQPKKASFVSKYGLYIGVGLVTVTLLSGLGWFAVQILKPAPVHTQRSTAPEPFGSQFNRPEAQQSRPAVEPVEFGEETTDQSKTQDQLGLATPNPQFGSDSPGSVLPITPRTEQEQDEQFYDTLVSAAEHNSVTSINGNMPTGQQGATPVKLAPETADKFAAISVAISNQSKEMTTVLEAVKNVSAEIKNLKAQVEASTSKNSLLEGKLSQLTVTLNDLSKTTETRLNEISKAAVTAALQAVKKEATGKTGGSGKLVLVGGPMQSDYKPEKAKRSEAKVADKPAIVAARTPVVTKPVAVKSQQETGNQAAKCGARTISQVWKVKGLTYSGAYVRRDDGSALMLRADMDVPGFGRVKSFDPESRTVCTTSGLIAR